MLNTWLEGQQLSNFKVEEFLGRGGMALVYRGWDMTLERPVAIKVIAAPYQEDPAYMARFIQEGRAMARWRHEHIVQIYYAGQEGNLNYLVMEYVDGTDLKSWLARLKEENTPVPHEEVVRIGKAVAGALDYAHAHGIVHRDVKPSNIMIAEDGRILLTDFGLALDLQEGSSGEVFGSPKYIAPEQARSSAEVVPQSDLYALGIILYEMLTGVVPFEAGSSTALAVQHLNQAPPLPRVINPALNEATEKVLLKSLMKSPENRFRSGELLMAALERALNNEPEIDSADLIPPAALEGELLPEPVAPGLALRKGKALPVAIIGGGILLLCVAAIVLAAFLIDGIGADSDPDSGSNGALAGSGAEQNGSPLPTPASSANGEGEGAVETPAPTVTLAGGASSSENRLVFFYNAGGFYAWNPSDRDINVREFSFEALDTNGNPTGLFFEARRWSAYYPDIQVGHCNRLEILNDVPKERPSQCQGYNAVITPDDVDPAVFWLPKENVSQFRVLFAGQEIGRCDIAAGQCETAVP